MADAPEHKNPWEPVLFIGAILVVLFALWWVRGGPSAAQLSGQGFFVSPTVPTGDTTGSGTTQPNQ